MRLRILGCSGGIGVGLRTTSYLLDEGILVDAGTGVGELELPQMCHIRHVFLTHSHLDHVTGLPLLVDSVFECMTRPLSVHAEPVTIRALQDHVLNWTIWPDFARLPHEDDPVMVYRPLSLGETVEVEGNTFSMIRGEHPVPSVAYVVQKEGRAFCFSGDTSTNDTLWEGLNALDRLDLLLIECGFPNENFELAKTAKHYCPATLAEDLKKLRHRPRVAITHLKPGAEDATWQQCQDAIKGFDLHRVQHGEVFDV